MVQEQLCPKDMRYTKLPSPRGDSLLFHCFWATRVEAGPICPYLLKDLEAQEVTK